MCPMSGGCSDYFRHYNYSEKIDKFVEIIQSMNSWDSNNLEDLHTYITSGGWENRRSGRGIKDNYQKYKERTADGKVEIELIDPSSDWREWLKTANTDIIQYRVHSTNRGYIFTVDEMLFKKFPSEGKYFRQALRKTAYCVGCKVCETNCKHGHLKFIDGKITI